ncbi:MAG: sugar isomerase, partial [Cytophagales bacterium]|nr:sugar isomerase [Cytophagales bacterium]
MNVSSSALAAHNERLSAAHQRQFRFLADTLAQKGLPVETLLDQIAAFQIAIPSWA